MKRLTVAAAAIALAAPIAATSSAYADPPRRHYQRDYDRDHRGYTQRDWRDNGRHWRRGQRLTPAQRAHFRRVN